MPAAAVSRRREGHAAFRRRDWRAARNAYAASLPNLSASESEEYAEALWWLGEIDGSLEGYRRVVQLWKQEDRPRRAAMAALLLGVHANERGEQERGSGWIASARRLLGDASEGAEHGYPLYFDVFAALDRGAHREAIDLSRRMRALGERFDDANLIALSLMTEGRSLLKSGEVQQALRLLDEALVNVFEDRVDPLWTGAIYCHLMDACHELRDVRRAELWTEAARSWVTSLSGAALYGGICRIHRAQLMLTRGAWHEAELEAASACRAIAHIHERVVAEGYYTIGELRRLQGNLAAAREAFGEAHLRGRDPQPGLGLLQADRGDHATAAVGLAAALARAGDDPLETVPLLTAQVEVALRQNDVTAAETAAASLEEVAGRFASDGLRAAAEGARGALLTAAGRHAEAMPRLASAYRRYADLGARYDAGEIRVWLARCHRALGDTDGFERELDAAEEVFATLGSPPGLAAVRRLRLPAAPPAGLTSRETEVLGLVSTGLSNREIAQKLTLSPKTVSRHMTNLYRKIGVSNRSGATAYAYQHGLAPASRPR